MNTGSQTVIELKPVTKMAMLIIKAFRPNLKFNKSIVQSTCFDVTVKIIDRCRNDALERDQSIRGR